MFKNLIELITYRVHSFNIYIYIYIYIYINTQRVGYFQLFRVKLKQFFTSKHNWFHVFVYIAQNKHSLFWLEKKHMLNFNEMKNRITMFKENHMECKLFIFRIT
jgi:hypothetical protein